MAKETEKSVQKRIAFDNIFGVCRHPLGSYRVFLLSLDLPQQVVEFN